MTRTELMTQNPNFKPLYAQVKELMVHRLAANVWMPGMALPSENQLAKEFGVSQGTVRKALDELTAEHLLVRRQGRGTFVAEHTRNRALFHFLHLVGENDRRQLPNSRVLRITSATPSAAEVEQLALEDEQAVIRICRVRYLNDEAVIYEIISVPGSLFPGLEALGKELPDSLYGLYERQYGLSVTRAVERLSASTAQGEVASQLALPPGAPLLSIQRTAYTLNARPVELRISHCDTHRHHYLSELT